MTITVSVEIDNTEIKNFSTTEQKVYDMAMRFGRELMRKMLEIRDVQLMAERDAERYRNKGPRKTCIKTMMGEVEYERRVYQDTDFLDAESGKAKSVYLLDEELAVDKIGNISAAVCKQIASTICESSYRATARQISEQTGQRISAQGVWDVVQEMGQKIGVQSERNAELDEAQAGKGEVTTKILYEENDGIWIGLQRKSRKENGPSKEMKVGIAYDGARWDVNETGEKRRILDNKVAIAGFMPIGEYRRLKEGLIGSVFSKETLNKSE